MKEELLVGLKGFIFNTIAQILAGVMIILVLGLAFLMGDSTLMDILSAILLLVVGIGSYIYINGYFLIKFKKWIYGESKKK